MNKELMNKELKNMLETEGCRVPYIDHKEIYVIGIFGVIEVIEATLDAVLDYLYS